MNLFKNLSSCRRLNGFINWIFFSLSTKPIILISCIIFCIFSFQYLINDNNFQSSYIPNKGENPVFNKKMLGHRNVTLRALFNDEILKVNNIELKEFSGEYEELPEIEAMNNKDYKYVIEDIYFLLTTNTKRIHHTIDFIRFWAKFPNIKCLIVFEEKDFLSRYNMKEYLLHEQIQCEIDTSIITRYEERYLELIKKAWNKQIINDIKKIQWFAIGDDDTMWFIKNLLKTLQQYNSLKLIYLGNISDRNQTIKNHGSYYAYGGGGILLSRPLASLFTEHYQQCKQFLYMFGGDEMIGKCLTQVLNINLTINKNFHQMDHQGDYYGYLQSGIRGLVSLHHMFSLWEPFPEEHIQNEKEIIDLIELAYRTFDFDFLKRYFRINYQTNQTLLLTIGYSCTLFNRILSLEELLQVELTWCCSSQMVQRVTRRKENNAINWYFKRLTTKILDHHLITSSIYEYNHKRMYNHIPPSVELILNN